MTLPDGTESARARRPPARHRADRRRHRRVRLDHLQRRRGRRDARLGRRLRGAHHPRGLLQSVTSISGETPTQANLDIRTDDAHGYLAGSVAQSVGDAMSTAFGRELTKQYLEGFYTNLATMGGALGDAADGATQLSTGVGSLANGLGTLSERGRFGSIRGDGCRERSRAVRRRRHAVHERRRRHRRRRRDTVAAGRRARRHHRRHGAVRGGRASDRRRCEWRHPAVRRRRGARHGQCPHCGHRGVRTGSRPPCGRGRLTRRLHSAAGGRRPDRRGGAAGRRRVRCAGACPRRRRR